MCTTCVISVQLSGREPIRTALFVMPMKPTRTTPSAAVFLELSPCRYISLPSFPRPICIVHFFQFILAVAVCGSYGAEPGPARHAA